MRLLNWLLFIVVMIVGIVFACLNAEPVSLHYYLGTQTFPLSALLVGSLIIGMLLGALFCWLKIVKLKIQLARMKHG